MAETTSLLTKGIIAIACVSITRLRVVGVQGKQSRRIVKTGAQLESSGHQVERIPKLVVDGERLDVIRPLLEGEVCLRAS